MTETRVVLHTTHRPCAVEGCTWTGYHFHWRGERYRTAFESLDREPALPPALLDEFDEDCRLDLRDRQMSSLMPRYEAQFTQAR